MVGGEPLEERPALRPPHASGAAADPASSTSASSRSGRASSVPVRRPQHGRRRAPAAPRVADLESTSGSGGGRSRSAGTTRAPGRPRRGGCGSAPRLRSTPSASRRTGTRGWTISAHERAVAVELHTDGVDEERHVVGDHVDHGDPAPLRRVRVASDAGDHTCDRRGSPGCAGGPARSGRRRSARARRRRVPGRRRPGRPRSTAAASAPTSRASSDPPPTNSTARRTTRASRAVSSPSSRWIIGAEGSEDAGVGVADHALGEAHRPRDAR